MKYYKISEAQLINFISDSATLCMLEHDGVDNWIWYGESRQEFLDEWAEELGVELDEDTCFHDLAKIEVKQKYMELPLYETNE